MITAGGLAATPAIGLRRQRFPDGHLPQLRGGGPGRRFPVQLHHSVIGQRFLLGDDMNHDGAGLHPRRVAPRILAAARQPVTTVPQRPQRIGAALLEGARITVAHRPGHRVQAPVQRVGVGGEQQRLDARRTEPSAGSWTST